MGRQISDLTTKSVWLFSIFVCLISSVHCDELVAENRSNLRHITADPRPSDVHVRSVAEEVAASSDSYADSIVTASFKPAVGESILTAILAASSQVASQKCRDDIEFTLHNIRRNQHWALQSKYNVTVPKLNEYYVTSLVTLLITESESIYWKLQSPE